MAVVKAMYFETNFIVFLPYSDIESVYRDFTIYYLIV